MRWPLLPSQFGLHAPAEELAIPGNEEFKEAYDDWREASGLKGNGAGDLDIFLNSLWMNSFVLLLAFVSFGFLRRWLPQVFANNVREKEDGGTKSAPFEPSADFWGWARAGFSVTLEEVRDSCGVDAALILEFTWLSAKLLLAVGIPLVVVLCPLHYFIGGGRALQRGDALSTIGLNNVVDGSPLFWVHACFVWYVVLVAEYMLFVYMRRFMAVRTKWLLDLDPPQAVTVLVEDLPEKTRTDQALYEYFDRLFPGCVDWAHVVKNTRHLRSLVEQLKHKRLALEMLAYKHDNNRTESTSAWCSGHRTTSNDRTEEEMQLLTGQVEALEAEARRERARILKEEEVQVQPCLGVRAQLAVSTSSGFVTFTTQRAALIALTSRCSSDKREFVMSIPPPPDDVIYEDLFVPKFNRSLLKLAGAGCIALLFWSYIPFVVILSTLTNLQALMEHSEWLRDYLLASPRLHTVLDGVLSTLALVIFVSFLPTILMLIFSNFYSEKAHAWAQVHLQRWYFGFNAVYILFITAVGSSLLARVKAIWDHPGSCFDILADALPTSTNFYLDYILVQWIAHGLNLTRYMQVFKFLLFRGAMGEKRAIELSEPEDQDYYGIGARSARLALELVIALVFCSLSPLITLITAANFLISHVVYGYLMVFAETRKPDLGGPFFVQKLWHVHWGLLLYAVLMCSIFYRRAGHWGPVLIAGACVAHVLYCMWRFHGFVWRALALSDLCTEEALKEAAAKMERYREMGDRRPRYLQPELREETWGAAS